MSIRQALGTAAVVGLCLLCPPGARRAAAKQTLTFQMPTTAAGDPKAKPKAGPTVRCAVTFGPVVSISALAFAPDGKTLAAGGYKEVLIWDLAQAKLAKRIGAGQLSGDVRAVAFVDKGQSLAVGDGVPYQSGAVKVFDVKTGKLTATLQEPKEVVYCLAVSPDGKLLAAGGADTAVHVWNVKDKKLATTIRHNGWVYGISFSRDSKMIATASADKTLRVREVGSWKRIADMRHAEPLHDATFVTTDGRYLVAAVGGPSEWSIRIRRKDNIRYSRLVSTGEGMPLGLAWAARAARVFVACSDNTLRVYHPTQARYYGAYRGHTDWVYVVALSSDETKLASGSADGTVRLWLAVPDPKSRYRAVDSKPLATLVQLSPGTDQWLIVTAPGYLATSAAGAIQWDTKGAKGVPTDPQKLTGIFQNAESVRKVLAGATVAPPVLK